jgi:formylglycine-generating enzyme required for sulfatase activity
MLRLSNLDSDAMTDDQRDAFVNMAESLGLEPGEAEDLIDLYLEQPATGNVRVPQPATGNGSVPGQSQPQKMWPAVFVNSLGGAMRLVPSGTFIMGSDARAAGPKESPLTKVSLSRFYMSQHLITNKQYEEFDKSHARKRAPATGDLHPVAYVSSLDAIRFCEWVSARERRKYRLPTEAEWEYAARGTDGRKFPWGSDEGRGDLANFADRNAAFVWSDREIDDGYAESSPVGAFPRGASPFGMEDMAGNVWEWCLDYFGTYRGTPRTNPRGATSGTDRVCRGGSWKSRFDSLRTTSRGANAKNYSSNDLGFRIVCECE